MNPTKEQIEEALAIADKWADKHSPYRILAAAYRAEHELAEARARCWAETVARCVQANTRAELAERQYAELLGFVLSHLGEIRSMDFRHEEERKDIERE
jgi:type I restriction-modification system DNA methylase subunit